MGRDRSRASTRSSANPPRPRHDRQCAPPPAPSSGRARARPCRATAATATRSRPTGSPLRPLQSDEILFFGRPVALVVAETFEAARHAATLVRVEVEKHEHATDLEAAKEHAFEPPHRGKQGYVPPPKPRGDADAALAAAAHVVDAVYTHPIEHHNPMEPHATTVVVEADGALTILGAAADGTLTAIVHRALGNTSRFESCCENVVPWSGVLYQCDRRRCRS